MGWPNDGKTEKGGKDGNIRKTYLKMRKVGKIRKKTENKDLNF